MFLHRCRVNEQPQVQIERTCDRPVNLPLARFFGYVRRQQAIARATPPGTAPRRYPPPDRLLAFLDGP
jgi:hypothetical protein